jgi:galactose-1-phosphate uridylyltransferase
MRQVTVTIPDEHYDDLINFLKPIPETVIDNREEEYNKKIQEMVLDRVNNSKPEDYVSWEECKKRLNAKWNA